MGCRADARFVLASRVGEYAPAMTSEPKFDLERVEVMRGPQGTAFGRNASVGLIHFVSNRPSQDASGGAATLTLGSDELIELDGFFTGQFSDTVSAPRSGLYSRELGPS